MEILKNASCRNAYSDRVMLSSIQCTTMAVFMVLILITSVPINGLLVISILKTKLSHAISWYYMLLFAISGCCLGIMVIPINLILFTTQCRTVNCHLEYAAIFLGQTICQFTAYLTFLIALHRYFISVPGRKRHLNWFRSRHGAFKLTSIIFLVSIMHGLISVSFFGRISSWLPNFLLKVVDFILGLTIYFIYIRLYIRIRKYARNLRVRFRDVNCQVEPKSAGKLTRRPKYLRELAVTISLILVALAVCYVPFLVMDLWTSWYTFIETKRAPSLIRFIYYMTYGCVFFTSVANGAIIMYRDRDIRAFVKVAVLPDD